jgi:hypothetical protein
MIRLHKSLAEALPPDRVEVVGVAQVGNVGVAFDCEIDLFQDIVGLLLGELLGLFLLVLDLLAHQDLLEFLGKDVDVAG